jgi:hypothetical protein
MNDCKYCDRLEACEGENCYCDCHYQNNEEPEKPNESGLG